MTPALVALLSLVEGRLTGDDISWLLMDARSGRVVGERWTEVDKPAPVGSLRKPFTALAYGASHNYRYPVLVCAAGGCWLPRGHGRIGVVEALAQSCNSYFEQIARETSEDATLTSPATIARAYCELARRAGEPGVDQVLRGLAASAARGTARGVGSGALAKTGTAPCTHARRAPGDGFAIVLYPASNPEFALLVRRHGAPGSEAARQAGEIVRLWRGPP